MKFGIILYTLVICNTLVFSQNQIPLIPLNSANINFDRKTERNLNYNEVSIDSINAFILSKTIEIFKLGLSSNSELNINAGFTFTDSLIRNKTSQKKEIIDSLNGVKKYLIKNENLDNSTYQSRPLSEILKTQLKDLFDNKNLKYVVILNKFETATPRPFCNKTYFSIHMDIYDSSLNKVYGGKSVWKKQITKKMYFTTLKYYTENMLEVYFAEFYELKL
ncbi:MAG: hypothetical protein ACI9N1_001168 [Flavobacteriales bacterium]|jgi:hypothetical protein